MTHLLGDTLRLRPHLTWDVVLLCLCLGTAANVVAELFLAIDLHHPYRLLSVPAKRLRWARWLLCPSGLFLAGLFNQSPFALTNLALFTVTAATDLETKCIPPDWFTYGCVVLAGVLGLVANGVVGLRDVVVAQAICFAIMVTAVIFAHAAAGGDVKVLMQYGASCGTLSLDVVGIAVETAVRVVIITFASIWAIAHGRHWHRTVHNVLHMRLPHAPVAWLGVLSAIVVAGIVGVR